MKDMAAGAVLVFSIASAVCGVLLFWDPAAFARMWHFFLRWPALAVVLAATLVLAFRFIFGKKGE